MDTSLTALCEAVKKILIQLKPQNNALSFVLLIGKPDQGKSSILRQSSFEHVSVNSKPATEVYYNQNGLIVELSEIWLLQNKNLLQYTLKQLNRCHRQAKITGIILTIGIPELFLAEPQQLMEQMKRHAQLLERFGTSLGYCVDLGLVFNKLDVLAGFCDFFQYEHESELDKAFGFSLPLTSEQKLTDAYKIEFEQFIESLSQQVLNKIHPARSSIKRTLIREFPLQVSSLRTPIHWLINNISVKRFTLHSIYFTSAEQGGMSLDRLSKKIEHEYALTIQDKFPQSHNYRAYFIEGALLSFQTQTQHQTDEISTKQRWLMGSVALCSLLSLSLIGYQHFRNTHLLDEASKELIAFDTLSAQATQPAAATYHLTKASKVLGKIPTNNISLSIIKHLQTQLATHANEKLSTQFIPTLLNEIEEVISNAQQSQIARYQALKIYVMLGQPEHFSKEEVLQWYGQHWGKTLQKINESRQLALLQNILNQEPHKAFPIKMQIITDARNYLNALPASYLYYSLAKLQFKEPVQKLDLSGFVINQVNIPGHLTKAGFTKITQQLPKISQQLQAENWVLARQDLQELPSLLLQAYCFEYTIWWQNFMRQLKLTSARDYTETHELIGLLQRDNQLMHLINIIQQQISPMQNAEDGLFNREIASKFTALSLMSQSAIQNLSLTMQELERFLTTLAVVNDQGRTAFNLVKSRFNEDMLANPLSALYSQTRQLPEPISVWAKQIADDTWFSLINNSRNYINLQWQQLVLHDYQTTIAHRYPFDTVQEQEIALSDFERFFAPHGTLNRFIEEFVKPFLDTSKPQWELKQADNYVVPISSDMINELIRANVITNMFFPNQKDRCQIEFSLQKLSLDPVVASLRLTLGDLNLTDNQNSESFAKFHWPLSNARLLLNSIEGHHYELAEMGPWAFFKMLQKVNVLVDEQDSANLEIMFEINGNSGRYLLKTQNQINPFIPGILQGFNLAEAIV